MKEISNRPTQRPTDPSFYDGDDSEKQSTFDDQVPTKHKKGKKSSGGFQSLGLSEQVYRGIVKMGFRVPTPVQRKALPICLSGVDTVVMARTGSGKTAAFVLPILEKLVSKQNHSTSISSFMLASGEADNASGSSIKTVILSPTRELALQTLKVFKTLSTFCENITATGIIGADSIEKQFAALAARPDVLVATPGRLAHLLVEIPDFHLKSCEILVLDEADRLFEMGFAHQIRDICRTLPKEEHACQKMLFSATMPKGLVEFTREGTGVGLLDPVVVRLDNEVQVSDELRIGFITCRTEDKDAVLLFLVRDILLARNVLKKENEVVDSDKKEIETDKKGKKKKKGKKTNEIKKHEHLTLIFCATRHHVEFVTTLLISANIPATMIYGSMDLEARKSSLHAFRSGHCPVLVVTDVAARGIDIPLIENVIHHSFPPSAKLFIHRSGRAARAGRIGYCFGLVDPEELPYMVDLHVFLGYKLSSGSKENEENNTEPGSEQPPANKVQKPSSYTLDEMTPEMVHHGSVPEWILTEQVEELHRLIQNGENTTSMKRVCQNAMKQYRRSRPDASRAGIKTAKQILEQNRSQDYHPLLRKIEEDWLAREGTNKADDLKKRQEFLRAMASFRPRETIFEAFATGAGSSSMLNSQVDKGKTVGKDNAAFNTNSLKVMKSMRRQMRFVRNKDVSMVVAGSTNAKILNGDVIDEDNEMTEKTESGINESKSIEQSQPSISSDVSTPHPIQTKQRLSKAQRKQMKKNKNNERIINPTNISTNKKSVQTDYRDHEHYIDTTQNFSERQARMESAMQPSSSATTKDPKTQALRMEETMLDIVGDENSDLVMKQRMMRWDKSKRKYIQTTLGQELKGGPGSSKKIMTESGKIIKTDKAKVGELYEKWQKKTRKSIGRSGVFDDDGDDGVDTAGDEQVTKMQKRAAQQNKNLKDDGKNFGLKSASQIKKDREATQKQKIKNMERGERRKFEARKKAVHDAKKSKKGYQGKKGFSGNWGKKKR